MADYIIDVTGQVSVGGSRIKDGAAATAATDFVILSQLTGGSGGGALPAGGLSTRWEPLTNGDEASPEMLFDLGDVLMVEVPN